MAEPGQPSQILTMLTGKPADLKANAQLNFQQFKDLVATKPMVATSISPQQATGLPTRFYSSSDAGETNIYTISDVVQPGGSLPILLAKNYTVLGTIEENGQQFVILRDPRVNNLDIYDSASHGMLKLDWQSFQKYFNQTTIGN